MIKLHKNQQGIIHHLALIILAVVVVAGVGFTGYKVYQAKYGIKAKAVSYSTNLLTQGPVKIYICKTGIDNKYGIFWGFKMWAVNTSSTKMRAGIVLKPIGQSWTVKNIEIPAHSNLFTDYFYTVRGPGYSFNVNSSNIPGGTAYNANYNGLSNIPTPCP